MNASTLPPTVGARLFPSIAEPLAVVEERLRGTLNSYMPIVPEVFGHTVRAGGKRIRPALALLGARLVGAADEHAIQVACAVELIHLASLLHDDVVDGTTMRRAQRTANSLWGNKQAVLVADFANAVAFRKLAEIMTIDALTAVSDTVVRMSEGELRQMAAENRLDIDEDHYYAVIGDKTASLISLSGELGAIMGGGDAEQVAALGAYGDKLGLAFQIVDDLLDLTSQEAVIGKPVGNDISCGRVTLAVIHGLRDPDAGPAILELVERAFAGQPDLAALRKALQAAGSLDYALGEARRWSREAVDCLAGFPPSADRDALGDLAAYVVAREL